MNELYSLPNRLATDLLKIFADKQLDGVCASEHNQRMNFQQLLSELSEHMTLQKIADECGMASRGHVHDLISGRQKTVSYEAGLKLVALHKKAMRRKDKTK